MVPPGEAQATLRMVSFRVEPEQAVGVIGPSASGKSTLARLMSGIWEPVMGTVRIDGAASLPVRAFATVGSPWQEFDVS